MPEAVGRSSPGRALMQEPDMMGLGAQTCVSSFLSLGKAVPGNFLFLGRLASAVSVSE